MDIILTGASFAARTYQPLAISYFPFIFRDAEHQLKYANSDVFRELAAATTRPAATTSWR